MKRGRDKLTRVKAKQRALDRTAYSTIEKVPFNAILLAGKHAERHNLDGFSDRTVKVVWPEPLPYFTKATLKRLKALT